MRDAKGQFVKGSKLGFQKGHQSFLPPRVLLKKVCLTCNQEFTVDLAHKTKKVCSLGCRNMSHMSGDKNHKWIADRSKIKVGDRQLHDPLQKQWRREVKNRDRWVCRIADVKCKGRLEAHHILPWSKFPELRYKINNGITLCHFHHPRKMDEVKKLSPYFQQLVAEM